MITVSVAGSDTRRLAAESRRVMDISTTTTTTTSASSARVAVVAVAAASEAAAVAVGDGRGLLAVVDGRRHGRWWRVHVHQHHGATLAATALALRQKDLRVQFLQLRLFGTYTHNLIAVNDRKSLSLHSTFLSLSLLTFIRGSRSPPFPRSHRHTQQQQHPKIITREPPNT